MKTLPVLFVFFAALLFTSCGTTSSLPVPAAIDGIMKSYTDPSAPGASVLVMKNDSVVFKKGYGIADMESGTPVTAATNFRLASVSKQFTAMSVMLLAEQGMLSYEDRISKFFPDFPAYGFDITVRHLLTHTSGLVDYESVMPDTQTVQVHDADCLTLMHAVDSLYFPAGSRYAYSNTGYALLALIVEKVSGQRYADYLKKNIFDRTGMSTSVAFEEGISVVPNRAYGHSLIDGAWRRTDQSSTSAVLGDGGIYSNVEEMSRWISSLWKYSLISKETQQLAWSDAALGDGSTIDYGFGWHKQTYRGIRHPHHGGSTRGFRNHILLLTDQKLMVVILTNRNQGDPISEAKKIADLFWEER
jgi:CubicO group peptidase (beta-lactamase class C family)